MHTYIIGCALKDFHFYEGGANVLIRFPSINTELNDSQNYDIYLHKYHIRCHNGVHKFYRGRHKKTSPLERGDEWCHDTTFITS